ncbi:DNA replication/repair protein RecF [Algicola sagamiensis]|uniref:DNA replication/repair protein RecF n=1 Tax=Algicola sagamiensis TaxID=163869 RepID=UPI000364C71A|nr:DNA replication/repair protein RecF [Algicola sagamiensis]
MGLCIQELVVEQFRNLTTNSLTLASDCNIFLGENGSGKTSLLEAIYYLSCGRSFRTQQKNRLLQHEQPHFFVTAELLDEQGQKTVLGSQRTRAGEVVSRISGQPARGFSEIARFLPLQLITPETFKLFIGGAKERRKFVDLGVFHVEHQFHQHWLSFSRVLKHRNALLKQIKLGVNQRSELKYWNDEFVRLSEVLNQFRRNYVERLNQVFEEHYAQLFQAMNLALHYKPGWNEDIGLASHLKNVEQADFRYGYSTIGAHKFDLVIKSGDSSVEDYLSRGQLKLLIYCLKLAQNRLLAKATQTVPVLLVDDIPSELDNKTLGIIFDELAKAGGQKFITAIQLPGCDKILSNFKSVQMFHVKHGEITQEQDLEQAV